MLRCNWNDMELEARYGGKGFWHDRQAVFSKQYNGYMVEVYITRDFHDNGHTSKYWSVHLSRYDELGWIVETYCLDIIYGLTEMWKYLAELELDSTLSAIQTARNPWCELLAMAAIEHGQLTVENNSQVYTFEPDYDEFVIEVWSQYRLENGALTTMSYCGNIWEDELPVNMRKAVFGV